MSRRNKPQQVKADTKEVEADKTVVETEAVKEEAVVETQSETTVTTKVPVDLVEEVKTQQEEVVGEVKTVEAEVVEEPEVVTSNTGDVEVESKQLSQEQADKLAASVEDAGRRAKEQVILEKQKAVVRQYAFNIFNSMIMSNVPVGSEGNREKFVKLSIETAKDFIKHSKDFDMDGVV